MLSSSVLIALAIGGCLACLILFLASLRSGYSSAADARLHELAQSKGASTSAPSSPSPWLAATGTEKTSGLRAQGRRLMDRLVPVSKADQQVHQSRLYHAGIYNPSALRRFFAVKLLLLLVPPVTGAIIAGQGLISLRMGLMYGALGGGIAMILPSFWLDHRIAARHLQLRRSLPDFLDLMIICFDGGLSLQGAIQRVSDELKVAHPILAGEMQTVQRDVEIGATVEGALRNLAERTGLDNLRTLSTFVRESLKFGTEISDTLRQHADMLRNQREQAAEAQAQRAAVHILLPTLLLILPAVFVVVAGPAAIQINETFSKRSEK